MEAHKAPLNLRSEKLTLQFYLKSYPSNTVYDCTFNPKYTQLFEQKGKGIKPSGLHIKPTSEESQIPLTNLHDTTLSNTPPLTYKQPEVIFDLSKLPKMYTHLATYQEKTQNIMEQYPNHSYVFTDRSKDNDKTVSAAVLNQKNAKRGLPKETSIFSEEVYAIGLALSVISKNKSKNFIIFSNSFSILLFIKN